MRTTELGRCGPSAEVQTSWDPNDITARPAGVGDAGHIGSDETLRYRVRFENLENATAAAKDVTVAVPVDSALDFDSIETRATSHPDVIHSDVTLLHATTLSQGFQAATLAFCEARS